VSWKVALVGFVAAFGIITSLLLWYEDSDEQLIQQAKDKARSALIDPASAQFDGTRVVKIKEGRRIVCGMVNGRNRFGGYVGMQPFLFDGYTAVLYGGPDNDVTLGLHRDKVLACDPQQPTPQTAEERDKMLKDHSQRHEEEVKKVLERAKRGADRETSVNFGTNSARKDDAQCAEAQSKPGPLLKSELPFGCRWGHTGDKN